MPKPRSEESAVVVAKAYDFLLWLLPKVESFSRSYRFSVGDRLVTSGLDLLMILVQSAYASEKTRLLREAGQKANCLRYLLRLSKDLRLINLDSYGFSAERIEEIGRMIGGWQKFVEQRA